MLNANVSITYFCVEATIVFISCVGGSWWGQVQGTTVVHQTIYIHLSICIQRKVTILIILGC